MRVPHPSLRSLVLVAITLLALISSAFVIPEAQPQSDPPEWYDTSWVMRRPVTIDNSLNPSNLIGYQVRITVDYDSDMKSDFSDLRFTENETLLPYWIETYTANTSATIWVKTLNISASSNTTIYMYYRNPSAASASNGTATFEFFDDFSGDTLNPNKWIEDAVNNITQTVSNYFRFEDAAKSWGNYWIYDGTDRGSQHHAQWTPLTSFIVDFTSGINDVTNPEIGQGFVGLVAPDNTVIGVAGHQDHNTASSPSRAVVTENAASSNASGLTKTLNIYSKPVTATDSTRWTIANNGTTLKFYDSAGFFLEAPVSSSVSKLALVAGAWQNYPFLDYVEENNVRVRKYTVIEPSSVVGLEEDYRMKAKVTWWNLSWPYRSPINVTENSSSDLTDYQVKLTVDYVSSRMKPDFSDLRFIDSDQATVLSYWIESFEPSVSAVIWVKVPLIPASGTRTIYMYYGNPSATSAANGKNTFEIYEDFETVYEGPSQWTEKQPLPEGRSDSTAAVYGGKIYVFGGYYDDTSDVRNETFEYDPLLNTWTQKADMPTRRWGPVAVEFNGLIYVFGGFPATNANEVYNPSNDTWQTKNSLPVAFGQGSMATRYGDKIHLFYTGTHYEYDPATDTYVQKAGMPTSRYWAACAVANDRIYVIGGYRPNTSGAVNVNEAYNPATNKWATKAPMPVSKWGGGRESPIIDGKIYVTHGRDVDYFFGTNYVYDVQTDSWQQKSPAVHPRAGACVSVVNNKLYVIGGVVRVEGQDDIGLAYNEQYDPATDTWIESPWNVSDPDKVRIDSSAKYEGAHGLLIDEDLGSVVQFAQRSQNHTMCAVDFYWNVTDYYGVNGLQPKGMILLSDSSNPGNGALYYYDDDGSEFFWFREGEFTYLQEGSWNAWYPMTVVWSGADSRVIINGTEHSVSSAQVNSDRIYFGTEQQTRMYIDLVRVRKYATPPPNMTIGAEEEPAIVQSCDSVSDLCDVFYVGETVYLKGSNLLEETNYNVYIVNDVAQWNNGDPIPERIVGTASTLSSDSSGNIQSTLAWNLATVGDYDVVLDVFENGFYDAAFDALCSFEAVVPPLRDVAVVSMELSEMNAGSGYSLIVNATVENQGEVIENINLTLFANDTTIANEIVTLGSGESTIVSSTWNTTGFSLGTYVISAHATPVRGETDIVDNTLNSTNVYVTVPGDIDCNRIVNVHDLWELGKAYAAAKGTPEWNPDADINNDEAIDNADIQIVSASWAHKW